MTLRLRHFEIFSVIASPLLAIVTLYLASAGLDLVGLLTAVLGYIAADFFCGAVHWYCDDLANESWRWIGPAIIRPFREHHTYPTKLTQHDVFELCGNNAMACAGMLAATLPWASKAPHVAIGVAGMAIAVLATNLFHRWAHTPSPPMFVRVLQKMRLVLSPREHTRHHELLDRSYCVTSGWTNTILDALIRRHRARHARIAQ